MQVKSIAECSQESILQYFQPSLSYHLSLRLLFCLFLSGGLRPVLLFILIKDALVVLLLDCFVVIYSTSGVNGLLFL